LFELAKITYNYWLIECTPKLSFVRVFKFAIIIHIYGAIECTQKA